MINIPTISIVMSVYNGELYLRDAIDSILNQTYTDFEFIIINDGSIDNTENIILEFIKIDNRIQFIKNDTNIGLIKSLNIGLSKAKGNYIARMDADDISNSTRIEKQFKFMESNHDIGICGTWTKCFGDSKKTNRSYTNHDQILTRLLFDSAISHPTFFFRKNLITHYNMSYNIQMKYAEDYYFLVDLIGKTKFANIPEYLLNYRIHSNSISSMESIDSRKFARSQSNILAFKKKLHYNISDEEIEIHYNYSHWNYKYTENELKEIVKWLYNLIKIGDNVGFRIEKRVILDRFILLTIKYLKNFKFKLFIKSIFYYNSLRIRLS